MKSDCKILLSYLCLVLLATTIQAQSHDSISPALVNDDEVRYNQMLELQNDPYMQGDAEVYVIGGTSFERLYGEHEFYLRPSNLDVQAYRQRLDSAARDGRKGSGRRFLHAYVGLSNESIALMKAMNIFVPEYMKKKAFVFMPEVDLDFLMKSGVDVRVNKHYGKFKRPKYSVPSAKANLDLFYYEDFEGSYPGSNHSMGTWGASCGWDDVGCNSYPSGSKSLWCADVGSDCQSSDCSSYVNNMGTWTHIDIPINSACYEDVDFTFYLDFDFYNFGTNDFLERYEDLGSGWVLSALVYTSAHFYDGDGWIAQWIQYNGSFPSYRWQFDFVSNGIGTSGGVFLDGLSLMGVPVCPSPPENDDCADAIVFPTLQEGQTINVATGEDVLGATQSLPPSTNCGSSASSDALDVWFMFQAICESHVVTVNPSSSMDAAISLHSTCTSSALACSDNGGGNNANETISNYTFIPGAWYYLRVYDYNSVSGLGTYPATTTFDLSINTPFGCQPCSTPSSPTNFGAESASSTDILVSWDDISNNEDSYELRFSSAVNGPWEVLELNENAEFATVGNLIPNTSYYFQVRACCESFCSNWLSAITETTQPATCVEPSVLFSANGSADGTTIEVGSSVQFSYLGDATNVSVQWVFEGGLPGESQLINPLVTYDDVGSYNVQLSAENSCGNVTQIYTDAIVVNPINSGLEDVMLYNMLFESPEMTFNGVEYTFNNSLVISPSAGECNSILTLPAGTTLNVVTDVLSGSGPIVIGPAQGLYHQIHNGDFSFILSENSLEVIGSGSYELQNDGLGVFQTRFDFILLSCENGGTVDLAVQSWLSNSMSIISAVEDDLVPFWIQFDEYTFSHFAGKNVSLNLNVEEIVIAEAFELEDVVVQYDWGGDFFISGSVEIDPLFDFGGSFGLIDGQLENLGIQVGADIPLGSSGLCLTGIDLGLSSISSPPIILSLGASGGTCVQAFDFIESLLEFSVAADIPLQWPLGGPTALSAEIDFLNYPVSYAEMVFYDDLARFTGGIDFWNVFSADADVILAPMNQPRVSAEYNGRIDVQSYVNWVVESYQNDSELVGMFIGSGGEPHFFSLSLEDLMTLPFGNLVNWVYNTFLMSNEEAQSLYPLFQGQYFEAAGLVDNGNSFMPVLLSENQELTIVGYEFSDLIGSIIIPVQEQPTIMRLIEPEGPEIDLMLESSRVTHYSVGDDLEYIVVDHIRSGYHSIMSDVIVNQVVLNNAFIDLRVNSASFEPATNLLSINYSSSDNNLVPLVFVRSSLDNSIRRSLQVSSFDDSTIYVPCDSLQAGAYYLTVAYLEAGLAPTFSYFETPFVVSGDSGAINSPVLSGVSSIANGVSVAYDLLTSEYCRIQFEATREDGHTQLSSHSAGETVVLHDLIGGYQYQIRMREYYPISESYSSWSNVLLLDHTHPSMNHAPKLPTTRFTFSNNVQIYEQLVAVDMDGDPVSFTLLHGPPNFTISSNGTMAWSEPRIGSSLVHLELTDGVDSVKTSIELFVLDDILDKPIITFRKTSVEQDEENCFMLRYYPFLGAIGQIDSVMVEAYSSSNSTPIEIFAIETEPESNVFKGYVAGVGQQQGDTVFVRYQPWNSDIAYLDYYLIERDARPFFIPGNREVCQGDSIDFINLSPVTQASFAWFVNDSLVLQNDYFSFDFSDFEDEWVVVKLEVTSALEDLSNYEFSDSVYVNARPTNLEMASVIEFCTTFQIDLVTNYTIVAWPDETSGNSWSHSSPGMFEVRYANEMGCENIHSFELIQSDLSACLGCADEQACNYSESFIENDPSQCTYPVIGDADFNDDCLVNSTDLIILLMDWGVTLGELEAIETDLNGDGIVGSADLLLLLTWFGI